MRQNSNSWVMIVLFAIIIFVFAINFGPWAGGSMSGVPFAAVVNGEPISMSEFNANYANQISRVRQFNPDFGKSAEEQMQIKTSVLEQLVYRELLTQWGQKYKFYIGAKPLAEEIKSRVFGEEAPFNKEEYVRRVHTFFQSTVSQFEQLVAKELVAQQMAGLFDTVAFISDKEIETAYKDRNTKIALEFIKIDPKHYKSTATVSDEQIKQYETAHGQEINDYYNQHISEYIKEAEIKASHILVKVPSNATDAEKAALKEKAEKILARVKNNEDFATVAKAESDDEASKVQGGDLGYFPAGRMVEEFSKVAFLLKPDEISNVVETPFGFHIIKQTDQKPKVERKLSEVSPEIAKLLLQKQGQDKEAKIVAEQALVQLQKGLPLSQVTVADLVDAKSAKAHAPVADETSLFAKSATFIPKIGRAAAISDEAFKLTKENPTASKIIEANDAFFALRLKERADADMTKFAEQKDSVKASLLYPRKRAIMQQFLSQMKDQAKIKQNNAILSQAGDIQ